MPNWTVWLSPRFIGWVRAVSSQRPQAFENYDKAVISVREIARIYSQNKVETCAVGFKIPVPNEDTEIRIAIDGEDFKFYIM